MQSTHGLSDRKRSRESSSEKVFLFSSLNNSLLYLADAKGHTKNFVLHGCLIHEHADVCVCVQNSTYSHVWPWKAKGSKAFKACTGRRVRRDGQQKINEQNNPQRKRRGRIEEERWGAAWSSNEWGRATRSSEGGGRQPPAGCSCWKADKREQMSAAGISNLSAAIPSCVTSRPSLGTGASLGALPLLRILPEENEPLKKPWPSREGSPTLAPAVTLLLVWPCAPVCSSGSDPSATPSKGQSCWTPCFFHILIYWPHQVLENSFRKMTISASMTAPLERKQRKAQTIIYLKCARSYIDAKATEPFLLSGSSCSLSWPCRLWSSPHPGF